MIFVTVGSQKFPFERLVKAVDELVEKGAIRDEVFIQIGVCPYEPRFCRWERFLDRDDFEKYISECDLLITHAGEGAIMSGLLRDKKVIAVPRYAKLGEHVSDHQFEIARSLEKAGNIVNVEAIEELEGAIKNIRKVELSKYIPGKGKIVQIICEYIDMN